MRRITNKTVQNIYNELISLSGTAEEVHLKSILNNYSNKQLQKLILSLEQGKQWESDYLGPIFLSKLKSELRERKLNQLL